MNIILNIRLKSFHLRGSIFDGGFGLLSTSMELLGCLAAQGPTSIRSSLAKVLSCFSEMILTARKHGPSLLFYRIAHMFRRLGSSLPCPTSMFRATFQFLLC